MNVPDDENNSKLGARATRDKVTTATPLPGRPHSPTPASLCGQVMNSLLKLHQSASDGSYQEISGVDPKTKMPTMHTTRHVPSIIELPEALRGALLAKHNVRVVPASDGIDRTDCLAVKLLFAKDRYGKDTLPTLKAACVASEETYPNKPIHSMRLLRVATGLGKAKDYVWAEGLYAEAIGEMYKETRDAMEDDKELHGVYVSEMRKNNAYTDEKNRKADAIMGVRRVMHWRAMERLRVLVCRKLRDGGANVAFAHIVPKKSASMHIYATVADASAPGPSDGQEEDRDPTAAELADLLRKATSGLFTIDEKFHGNHAEFKASLLELMGLGTQDQPHAATRA